MERAAIVTAALVTACLVPAPALLRLSGVAAIVLGVAAWRGHERRAFFRVPLLRDAVAVGDDRWQIDVIPAATFVFSLDEVAHVHWTEWGDGANGSIVVRVFVVVLDGNRAIAFRWKLPSWGEPPDPGTALHTELRRRGFAQEIDIYHPFVPV